MIRYFKQDISHIEPPEMLNNPFDYEPHALARVACRELSDYILSHAQWAEELSAGKMLGVLVVRTPKGELGYLAAFSGLLMGTNYIEGFVPAVYDMHDPEGYFRSEERVISQINQKIQELESSNQYIEIQAQLREHKQRSQLAIEQQKKQIKLRREERQSLRSEQQLDAELEAKLKHQSSQDKAELKRLKQRLGQEQGALEEQLSGMQELIKSLKEQRRELSAALQNWLFEQFVMMNARGEERNLVEIFSQTPQIQPPAGAGECAGPKLLHYAFVHGLEPLAVAEFWWGASPSDEIRRHGEFYGACKGKCEPILGFVLNATPYESALIARNESPTIETLFEDEYLMLVNKPHDLLTVPGRHSKTSLTQMLSQDEESAPYVVHRLDMATSGVVLIAKDKETQHALQRAFEQREIKKRYIALLDGEPPQSEGEISLPLSPDYNNRPRQRVDTENGKTSQTHYRVVGTQEHEIAGERHQFTRVELYPITGRTHQLRVHCAHMDGLSTPIAGDVLYGRRLDRLYLHAELLEFKHPHTGEWICVQCNANF